MQLGIMYPSFRCEVYVTSYSDHFALVLHLDREKQRRKRREDKAISI